MPAVIVPYHIDERQPDDFDALATPRDAAIWITAELPDGDAWLRMSTLYREVVEAVATGAQTVVSGDCTTALGTVAGLQRGGPVSVVWFDAHGDYHTEDTTTSGYLGGLPLAKIAGRGDLAVPQGLGATPVPEEHIVLVDARDLDPGEVETLSSSQVIRRTVTQLDERDVPPGRVYLHVDVDVVDSDELAGLRFPAPGGPSAQQVLDAVQRVINTGRVAALGIGCTWHPNRGDAQARRTLVESLLAAMT